MFLEPTCEKEVITEINTLNNTKSPCSDGLGPKLIKDTVHIIVKPLTYKYNSSFQVGIVPDGPNELKLFPYIKKELSR
jgi:hypothetical protein